MLETLLHPPKMAWRVIYIARRGDTLWRLLPLLFLLSSRSEPLHFFLSFSSLSSSMLFFHAGGVRRGGGACRPARWWGGVLKAGARQREGSSARRGAGAARAYMLRASEARAQQSFTNREAHGARVRHRGAI